MRHNDTYVYTIRSWDILPRYSGPPPRRTGVLVYFGGMRATAVLGVSEWEDYFIPTYYIYLCYSGVSVDGWLCTKKTPAKDSWRCVRRGVFTWKQGYRGAAAAARDRKGGGGFFEIWADNTTQYYMYIKIVQYCTLYVYNIYSRVLVRGGGPLTWRAPLLLYYIFAKTICFFCIFFFTFIYSFHSTAAATVLCPVSWQFLFYDDGGDGRGSRVPIYI